MFVVNDKGSSWAYSTPGFGAPLGLGLLRQLRDMAGVGDIAGQSKCHTEVRRGLLRTPTGAGGRLRPAEGDGPWGDASATRPPRR